jgi:hypothetical protein
LSEGFRQVEVRGSVKSSGETRFIVCTRSNTSMADYLASNILSGNGSKKHRFSGAIQVSIHLIKPARSRTKAYTGVAAQAAIDSYHNAPDVSWIELLAKRSCAPRTASALYLFHFW